jgi:hypothetical protein
MLIIMAGRISPALHTPHNCCLSNFSYMSTTDAVCIEHSTSRSINLLNLQNKIFTRKLKNQPHVLPEGMPSFI